MVAKPGCEIDIDEVRALLNGQLAAFKVPRYTWLNEEPLPRNASGKLLKKTARPLCKADINHPQR